MKRVPFSRSYIDPRRTNNFLDSCAFDPKYAPEDEAALQIQKFGHDGTVTLVLTHSNQKEIEHPNTPPNVKREAIGMIYTLETSLTQDELRRKKEIHAILTGSGNPEKYRADATHVFEAGKYMGYFITTDQRILLKRQELSHVCAAIVITPSEWLQKFHESASVGRNN